MAIAARPLTLEEFLNLRERKPAFEFEEGVVTRKVSPKGRHSVLQLGTCERVNQFARPLKLAYAFPELRATFGGRSLVPDVSVYRWERIPRDESGEVADDFLIAPDIAVEIVSPRQGVNALIRRCLWYAENGVRGAWLVDPADRSVIVFRADSRTRALRGQDIIELSDVLPGFQLTVDDLFAPLDLR